jgi:hypothetical protein
MNENGQPKQKIDVVLYEKNRRLMPPEMLEPYAGLWVAFSGDGTQVLASGPDFKTASDNLEALGIPGDEVGWARIPGLDEECWF